MQIDHLLKEDEMHSYVCVPFCGHPPPVYRCRDNGGISETKGQMWNHLAILAEKLVSDVNTFAHPLFRLAPLGDS